MDFADLRLPVGTRMQLNFVGLDYKRYPSDAALLGYRARESVLVFLPKKPPQVLLREGVKVEAKMVLQMGIISFASVIQLICEQPYTYLHFVWPHKIELEPLPSSGMIYSAEISEDTNYFTNNFLEYALHLKFDVRKKTNSL